MERAVDTAVDNAVDGVENDFQNINKVDDLKYIADNYGDAGDFIKNILMKYLCYNMKFRIENNCLTVGIYNMSKEEFKKLDEAISSSKIIKSIIKHTALESNVLVGPNPTYNTKMLNDMVVMHLTT